MSRSLANDDSRWVALENHTDASAVVTRRMEVIYLNLAARSLVPARWRGLRCWEIFPVRDRSCASRCPAIQAVQSLGEVFYCEEQVYPEGSAPLRLGVAVIPLREPPGKPHGKESQEARAVLLLRPKPPATCDETFRRELLSDAERLRGSRLNPVDTEADTTQLSPAPGKLSLG